VKRFTSKEALALRGAGHPRDPTAEDLIQLPTGLFQA